MPERKLHLPPLFHGRSLYILLAFSDTLRTPLTGPFVMPQDLGAARESERICLLVQFAVRGVCWCVDGKIFLYSGGFQNMFVCMHECTYSEQPLIISMFFFLNFR